MPNFVFLLIVTAGGALAALVAKYHPEFNTSLVMLGAVIMAAGVRAAVLGVFPKQLWGPGTIPKRED